MKLSLVTIYTWLYFLLAVNVIVTSHSISVNPSVNLIRKVNQNQKFRILTSTIGFEKVDDKRFVNKLLNTNFLSSTKDPMSSCRVSIDVGSNGKKGESRGQQNMLVMNLDVCNSTMNLPHLLCCMDTSSIMLVNLPRDEKCIDEVVESLKESCNLLSRGKCHVILLQSHHHQSKEKFPSLPIEVTDSNATFFWCQFSKQVSDLSSINPRVTFSCHKVVNNKDLESSELQHTLTSQLTSQLAMNEVSNHSLNTLTQHLKSLLPILSSQYKSSSSLLKYYGEIQEMEQMRMDDRGSGSLSSYINEQVTLLHDEVAQSMACGGYLDDFGVKAKSILTQLEIVLIHYWERYDANGRNDSFSTASQQGLRKWFHFKKWLPFSKEQPKIPKRVLIGYYTHLLGGVLTPCFKLHLKALSEYCVSTMEEEYGPSSLLSRQLDSTVIHSATEIMKKKRALLQLFDQHSSIAVRQHVPKEMWRQWCHQNERSELLQQLEESMEEMTSWNVLSSPEYGHYDDDDDEEEEEVIGKEGDSNRVKSMFRKFKLAQRSKKSRRKLKQWWAQLTPEMKWFVGKLVLPLMLNYCQGLHLLLWRRRQAIQQEKAYPVFPLF